jgi:hypothetical protein
MRIWARAEGDDGDGDDGDGDDGDDNHCDGDGVGVGDHSTRSTLTSRLATSTLASKLLQTWTLLLAKASTDFEPSISQSFHRLRVCHRPKPSRG